MEVRKITIVSTATQAKNVVETAATTLRELKSALRAAGIPYDGMTFYEGLSHTEMLTDDAVLPHDILYRGAPTNELVFMLTVPNKKINSGSDLSEARVALYEAIKEMHLEEDCIEKFGKNFTQCKNSELMSLIEEHDKASKSGDEKCECCCGEDIEKVKVALAATLTALAFEKVIDPRFAIKLVLMLKPEDTVIADFKEEMVGPKEDKSPYSDDEVKDMFGFLNK